MSILRFSEGLVLVGDDPSELAGDPPARPGEDWQQANPARIGKALARALAQPSGGWAVLDATRASKDGKPRHFLVAGRELVLWWADGKPRVGPDHCPHMSASLAEGHVDPQGRIVCPWHGLALCEKHGSWRELAAHDDGVLTWVRLPELLQPGEAMTDAPILPERPRRFLDAVVRKEARCAPADVLGNRLDPWHGKHFHGHSFGRLRVVDEDERSITVRVVYRIAGPLGVEVDARFHCPDPRTIVMTIVAGEGAGSTVETHATPMGDGRTAIVEATLATTARPEGSWLPHASLLRPLIAARATRLWDDDVLYCERTALLRAQGRPVLPIVDERSEAPVKRARS